MAKGLKANLKWRRKKKEEKKRNRENTQYNCAHNSISHKIELGIHLLHGKNDKSKFIVELVRTVHNGTINLEIIPITRFTPPKP